MKNRVSKRRAMFTNGVRAACLVLVAALATGACRDVLGWKQLAAGSAGGTGSSGGTGGSAASGGSGGTGGNTVVCTTEPTIENCNTPEDEACDGNAPDCGQGLLMNATAENGAGWRHVDALTLDLNGDLIVAGQFLANLGLVGCDVTATKPSAFVARLDGASLNCTKNWTFQTDSLDGAVHPAAVAVLSTGDIVIAGSLKGPIESGCSSPFDFTGVMSGDDVFFARINVADDSTSCSGFGTLLDDHGTGLLVQGDEFFLTGDLNGQVDLGPNCLLAAQSPTDAFVARFKSDDSCDVGTVIGGPGIQKINGVVAGGASNFFVTGEFSGTISEDIACAKADASDGQADMFVASLSGQDGSCKWRTTYGGSSRQAGRRIVLGAANRLVTTAEFVDKVEGSMVSIDSMSMNRNMLVLGLDASNGESAATFLWQQVPSLLDQSQMGEDPIVAVAPNPQDSINNIFVAGSFSGSIDLGGGPLAGDSAGRIFVEELTAAGEHTWSRQFGGTGMQSAKALAKALAVGKGGELFLAGDYNGIVDFGGDLKTAEGQDDIFVVKLSH